MFENRMISCFTNVRKSTRANGGNRLRQMEKRFAKERGGGDQRLLQQRACDVHSHSSDYRRNSNFLFFVFAKYMLPANAQADTWVSRLF
jgi:hypothetical protein